VEQRQSLGLRNFAVTGWYILESTLVVEGVLRTAAVEYLRSKKMVLIPFLLSDTVGFIRICSLVDSFKSTLDEVHEADLLLQWCSHPVGDHIASVKPNCCQAMTIPLCGQAKSVHYKHLAIERRWLMMKKQDITTGRMIWRANSYSFRLYRRRILKFRERFTKP
jgi:hypothetical protein